MFLANYSYTQESSLQKNSVYIQNFIIFPTLNYDRVIPIIEHFGIIPKVGFGYYDEIVPIIETAFFIGGNKHLSELGMDYLAFEGIVININYRYMEKKGFSYIPGEEGFPLIGFGYSF